MTSQSFFWLLLGGWAVALIVALIKLAFDALAADARGARLPARSLLSAVRTFVKCGAVVTGVVAFSMIIETINETWELSFKLFSYDLTAYSGSVKRVVLIAGVWIGSTIVVQLADRLFDKLLPDGPANQTTTAENSNAGEQRTANHGQPID
jgi:hypothetical protein